MIYWTTWGILVCAGFVVLVSIVHLVAMVVVALRETKPIDNLERGP